MQIGDFSMRPLRESDLRQVLEWRNSEHVHSVMLTDHKITWEEHYAWFKRHEHDEPYLFFIFQYRERPVGYISFNDIDFQQGIVKDSGVYLGEREGLPFFCGFSLFFMICSYAFECLNLKRIDAVVLGKNKASLFFNKKLGYEILPDTIVHKVNDKCEVCYQIRLFREVYEERKSKFINLCLEHSTLKLVDMQP